MIIKLKVSICTTLIFPLLFLFAEETPLEKLVKHISKLTSSYPQEKIHIHTDKPYYVMGEEIWLKTYLVTAEKNEPSYLSKILYVELVDKNNVIRKKLTLPVEHGRAKGNMLLLDSVSSGNFRLRAYTNYMRNFGESFFFEKQITIGKVAEETIANKPASKKPELDVQFFPEGGSLVNEIRSKVALKALTNDGLGAQITGYIENQNKEKVATFETTHAGMGVFALLPKPNESYNAVVSLPNGETKFFKLPQSKNSGQTLAVNLHNDEVSIKISNSKNLLNQDEFYVLAQANGVVYTSFKSIADNQNIVTTIPKSSFPNGVVHFTLFNKEFLPLAERLVFINHQNTLKFDLEKQTISDTLNSKSVLNLFVTDGNANAVDGNFSVSVTDAAKVPIDEDDETTIISNLLLTSDLRGYIEKPNYYFNNINDEKVAQLDALMLTQGWRRFNWKQLTAFEEPKISYRPEQSLEITGTITNLAGKPKENAKVSVFSNTKGFSFMLDTLSDATGNFVFDRLDIPDSVSLILQSKAEKNNPNVTLKLRPNPSVENNKFPNFKKDLSEYVAETKLMFQELNKHNLLHKAILLNTVKIVGKKYDKSLLNVTNSANASGAADVVVKSDKLQYETNILNALSRIPGVSVKNGMAVRASNRTVSITSSTPPPMLIVYDGVKFDQLQDPNFLSTVNPADIEGIEVLISNYNTSIHGPDGYFGIIFITSKLGNSAYRDIRTNTLGLKNFGFSVTKDFYIPAYENPMLTEKIRDLRSTIYWNPNVVTNVEGQASFSFYNAENPGLYRVTIEGMDAFGNIGRKVFTYQAK
ncbi:TonB-dependent receptor plug domain-containing protein [Pedobacter namyangjuensis]|uniref:TonB-dependent receptor plug domain-containing protein n=1 Tax=Pedobacter namyangjuensis TaxID=600626 RepID=UPI000DE47909|nr:TonB-dependent receptor plug domain-containing protein [Pedobacter namyangjuensis]